jgi:hypothetical protein
MVLDKPLALLREFLHEGDLLQEILVLVVVFDLDLLQREGLPADGRSVDVGVAAAQLLIDSDLF